MGNITDSIIKGDMRMKNIKEIGDFFINLNEYVYATDIETDEIVYMNHKALKAYGLESIEVMRYYKKLLLNVVCATTADFYQEPLRNGVIIILY